jgi:hypothetical protein
MSESALDLFMPPIACSMRIRNEERKEECPLSSQLWRLLFILPEIEKSHNEKRRESYPPIRIGSEACKECGQR